MKPIKKQKNTHYESTLPSVIIKSNASRLLLGRACTMASSECALASKAGRDRPDILKIYSDFCFTQCATPNWKFPAFKKMVDKIRKSHIFINHFAYLHDLLYYFTKWNNF